MYNQQHHQPRASTYYYPSIIEMYGNSTTGVSTTYDMFGQRSAAASTPPLPLPTVEEAQTSIYRNDTTTASQNTKTVTTRLFESSLRVDGIISCSHQQHDDQDEYLRYAAADAGFPLFSPTDTNNTASLSDSWSDDDDDEDDEWLEKLTKRFRPKNKYCPSVSTEGQQPAKRSRLCSSGPTDEEEVEHEAYGFLMRMKPHNYLHEDESDGEELHGDLDDSQYFDSNTSGVTFQQPTKLSTKLPNGIMNGVTSLLTQPMQHTVQARTA